MQVLFDHPVITVWYHAARKVVHHRVNRPILVEEMDVIQRAFTSGTDAIRRHGATKWLSDDTHQLVMPQEIQDWSRAVWFPATKGAGWKYWAIVMPESAVARLFISRLTAEVGPAGIHAQTFDGVPAALSWLDRVDHSVAAS